MYDIVWVRVSIYIYMHISSSYLSFQRKRCDSGRGVLDAVPASSEKQPERREKGTLSRLESQPLRWVESMRVRLTVDVVNAPTRMVTI